MNLDSVALMQQTLQHFSAAIADAADEAEASK